MPTGFDPLLDHTQLWVPLALTPEQRANHDEHYLQAFGTLKAGTTLERATAEMQRISAELTQEHPRENFGRTVRITPAGKFLVGDSAQQLWVLLGAVLAVLVIACLNVGNLLLARGTARTRELAVRAALGAGGRRIVRQLLTESVVLAVLGGAVGVALAAVLVQRLRVTAPEDVPRLAEASLDGVVLAFALGVTLASSLLFGTVPALRAARTTFTERSSGRPPLRPPAGMTGSAAGWWWWRSALAAALLVGAGLLVRTALYLARVEPGFRPHGLVDGAPRLAAGFVRRASGSATRPSAAWPSRSRACRAWRPPRWSPRRRSAAGRPATGSSPRGNPMSRRTGSTRCSASPLRGTRQRWDFT